MAKLDCPIDVDGDPKTSSYDGGKSACPASIGGAVGWTEGWILNPGVVEAGELMIELVFVWSFELCTKFDIFELIDCLDLSWIADEVDECDDSEPERVKLDGWSFEFELEMILKRFVLNPIGCDDKCPGGWTVSPTGKSGKAGNSTGGRGDINECGTLPIINGAVWITRFL